MQSADDVIDWSSLSEGGNASWIDSGGDGALFDGASSDEDESSTSTSGALFGALSEDESSTSTSGGDAAIGAFGVSWLGAGAEAPLRMDDFSENNIASSLSSDFYSSSSFADSAAAPVPPAVVKEMGGQRNSFGDQQCPITHPEILGILKGGNPPARRGEPQIRARPFRLDPQARYEIMVEKPKVRRRPGGSDAWENSGGVRGASEFWLSTSEGIRKRYGKVRLKSCGKVISYHEYTMLRGHRQSSIEDPTITVFELVPAERAGTGKQAGRGRRARPSQPPAVGKLQTGMKRRVPSPQQQAGEQRAKASHKQPSGAPLERPLLASPIIDRPKCEDPTGEQVAPFTMQSSNPNETRFISFQAPHVDSDGAIELGAIVRKGNGVKLESSQGDFAEWHRRVAKEPPFVEGEVVGFNSKGEISRRTKGAKMLGVISRRAVVEGSAPPRAERELYDTVAYTGVVPVRTVKGRAEGSRGAECERPCDDCGAGLLRAGDVLVPSGRNDGLAVAVAAALGGTKQWTTISRVATILKSDTTPWGRSSREVEVRMVVAAVIPPTETLKRRPAHKLMWCALGGMLLIIAVVVFVQVVMWMRMSSSQHAGQRLSSSDKASDLLPLCAASLANEDACRHLSGPARTACEHSCSCNPGYSGRAGEGCTKCVQGRYSAAARDTVAPPECTPCPTHASTRSNGATSLSMCACNPGYMVNLTTGMVGDLSPCTPCPSGMFSKGSSWSGLLSNEDFAAGVTFKKQCAACPAHSSTGGRIGTPSAVRQCIHIRGREATKRTCF
jgi:hypothetical protein